MEFHEKAKALKNKGKFNLRDIAEVCNLSTSTVSRYLSGEIVPPKEAANRIIDFMERSLDEKEVDQDMIGAVEIVREIYDRMLQKETREKRVLFGALMAVVVFVFAFFSMDLLNGSVGWMRY